MSTDGAVETVERYYASLRAGEPIHPFFVDDGLVLKVGIGERLVGAETVASGLREQTGTTDRWVVESRDLRVESTDGGRGRRERFAWFGDDVFLAWTDTGNGVRYEFDTRWTGALVRRDGRWRFVSMHVSTPDET